MTETKKAKLRIKQKALRDYDRNDPLREIAIRYGVTEGTISIWAKEAGRTRRHRGCRKKEWPDESHISITEAVRAIRDGKPTLDEIGAHWQMTRAGVHRIYHKWKNWKPRVPFKKGDKIRILNRDYEVLCPGVFGGDVRDLKTGVETKITWKVDGQFAVKL